MASIGDLRAQAHGIAGPTQPKGARERQCNWALIRAICGDAADCQRAGGRVAIGRRSEAQPGLPEKAAAAGTASQGQLGGLGTAARWASCQPWHARPSDASHTRARRSHGAQHHLQCSTKRFCLVTKRKVSAQSAMLPAWQLLPWTSCLPAMARQAIGCVPHKGEAPTWYAAMPLIFYELMSRKMATSAMLTPMQPVVRSDVRRASRNKDSLQNSQARSAMLTPRQPQY